MAFQMTTKDNTARKCPVCGLSPNVIDKAMVTTRRVTYICPKNHISVTGKFNEEARKLWQRAVYELKIKKEKSENVITY